MKMGFCVLAALSLTACGPSKELESKARKECEQFVTEKLSGVTATKVFDVWTKNDAIVVEVGYQQRFQGGDSYSMRKCVFDEKRGSISLPGIMDREWDRK